MSNICLRTITWSSNFETGVAEMDNDHRLLLESLNTLTEVCGNSGRESILNFLAKFETLILEHFAREEAMIDKYDYEYASQHREEHRQLHKEIGHQIEDLYEAHCSLTAVAAFLHDWLLKHITTSDRHLAQAINAEGTHTLRRACAA